MMDGGGRARLAFESFGQLGKLAEVGADLLEHRRALEILLAGEQDDAHAPAADLLLDGKAAQVLSTFRRHRSCGASSPEEVARAAQRRPGGVRGWALLRAGRSAAVYFENRCVTLLLFDEILEDVAAEL